MSSFNKISNKQTNISIDSIRQIFLSNFLIQLEDKDKQIMFYSTGSILHNYYPLVDTNSDDINLTLFD